MKNKRPLNGCMSVVAWIGFAFSLVLIGGAAWFHFSTDPIIRIPFVLFLGGGGLMIGLTSLGYLITGKIT